MDNGFPNLKLEKFAHSYNSFFDATKHLLRKADKEGTLTYIIPEKINKQYQFSSHSRNGLRLIMFLENTYISLNDKEGFISFLNLVLLEVIGHLKKPEHVRDNIDLNLNLTLYEFSDLAINTNDSEIFDLDFYYDKKASEFKRKLDSINTEIINKNITVFDNEDTNKTRYEECVAEFLSFKNERGADGNLFYNQSLDKLKRIIENTLENKYKKEDGSFPKLSNKKQISNILFDDSSVDFEARIQYIISNIHHEKGGQPKKFTEKEYVYLWLELNQILYLLNRYKK